MAGLFEKCEYLKQLFGKYFRKELTPEEQKDLDDWLNENEANRNLLNAFSDDGLFDKALEGFLKPDVPAAFARLQQRINDRKEVNPKSL
jgi:hypothetical protein